MTINLIYQTLTENYLFLFLAILNTLILLNHEKITSKLNFYDLPDSERKIHKTPVSNIGGLYFLLNLIVIFISDYFFELSLFLNFTNREILSLIIIFLSLYFIGYIDDKFNLSANQKLFINFILIYFFISFNDGYVLEVLKFSNFERDIYFGEFSNIFTVLCILLFMNAMNMFDGSNCQALTYFIFLSILFILINNDYKSLLYIFPVYFILYYLNFSNKLFLGNSGINSISFLFSIFFIKNYFAIKIQADEIFLLMIIPGLELIRLFFARIIKGKHPFKGDKNHIHHLLIKKFGLNKILFYLTILIFIPNFLFIFRSYSLVSIIMIIISYFILLRVLTKSNN